MRYAALRYFNAAGADPGGEIGEDHEPETHLIPLILRAALGRGDPISIYGTDYPTRDGTAIRDYIHVADLADAHVRALGHLAAGGDSAALNLGTGRGYSVREVIAAVERIGGRKVPQREAARRPGDPPELVADPALALSRLGWQPRHSDLDTIIATALAWDTRANRSAGPVGK
jgi:UDP-arabinose 4-epimerase